MDVMISNNLSARGALFNRYSKRLGVSSTGYDSEILWDVCGYCSIYPEIGAHLDYDMSAISRVYGVSVYTVRKTLVDFLSRLGLVEMCAAYLRYLHDVYEDPFGDVEGVLRL